MVASLPEGYTPAPRTTPADESGNVQTLHRKLDERIYLTVRPKTVSASKNVNSKNPGWMVPTVQVKTLDTSSGTSATQTYETLLDAAKRAVELTAGTDVQVRFLSACPLAVSMNPYPKPEGSSSTYYGDKIFYIKASYELGNVHEDILKSKNEDWAWLTRSEMVQRVAQDHGDEASLFYHYLL